MAHQWRGVVEAYRRWLPLSPSAVAVTLGEGGTPLVRSQWLSGVTGCAVWLKVEAGNPTGSFKDRGMTVAVSQAVYEGARALVCASTGNTSASMAAYGVRAGLTPVVLVPHGRVARGKIAQAVVHDATIVEVHGGFDQCLELARALADSYAVSLVNSVNRMRIEGQKTAAFEIVDFLGDAPDVHVLPVGNAGNITAYWQGFSEYADTGPATQKPRMWGFQSRGAAPIVTGCVVTEPDTVASAIRIGNPASWHQAVTARDCSGGVIEAVSDEQILQAQRDLAARDGVFVEPASAAGVAGLLQRHASGRVDPGQTITVTVTGHGLKDIDSALDSADPHITHDVPPDVHRVAAAAGLSGG